MRIGTAVLLAALVAAGTALGSARTAFTLPAPLPGHALAEFLPDGEPVFVVRHAEDEVGVVSAVGTHLGIVHVWCAAGHFVEPGPAGRWDRHGRYMGGPAPKGLSTWEATLTGQGSAVRLGRSHPAPGRQADLLADAGGPSCDADNGGDVRHDWSRLGPPRRPEDVDWLSRSGTFVRVAGVLDLGARPVRLCSPPRGTRTCPHDAPVVRGPKEDLAMTGGFGELDGWIGGEFLVRVQGMRAFADWAQIAPARGAESWPWRGGELRWPESASWREAGVVHGWARRLERRRGGWFLVLDRERAAVRSAGDADVAPPPPARRRLLAPDVSILAAVPLRHRVRGGVDFATVEELRRLLEGPDVPVRAYVDERGVVRRIEVDNHPTPIVVPS